MKRVVARVWEVCERTIMKTAILLQPPIASYAHAASRQRTMLRLTSVQMERYNEMFNYTLTSEKAKAIRLPSVGPMFIFVLGVRLELAREWLSVRSKWKIPDGAEMDILTMDTLIEDCRDCVDEAVRAKLFFLDVIQSICPKGRNGKLCTADFENTLKDVFEKYLGYVERWCDSIAQNGDLGRLFSRLEEEWRTAFQCSLHIHSGLDMLASSFCTYFPHLLDELVVKFWETSMDKISEKHGVRESEDERSFDETDNGYDSQTREQTTMFSAFRAYNSVIREVDFGEESVAVCVLIDSACYDRRRWHRTWSLHLLKEENLNMGGFLWLWNYRRVKLTLEENVMENIHYLRTDVVCAVGVDCRLEKRYPGMFELMLTSCSSHYNLHREVCRYVGDSYLADFGMQLVSRGLDVIHQWKELVAIMKPQPSPHIPLWASHAFNFIHFLTDPKYTEYLLDYQFQVLKADVEECKRLVLGDKDAITVTPRSRSSTMSSRKTSDEISSKLKKVSLESRRARLEAAALETDAKVAKRVGYQFLTVCFCGSGSIYDGPADFDYS
ncbi:hypothetical protein OSTOST_03048 [Ostertagia ostertagi]